MVCKVPFPIARGLNIFVLSLFFFKVFHFYLEFDATDLGNLRCGLLLNYLRYFSPNLLIVWFSVNLIKQNLLPLFTMSTYRSSCFK